MKLKFWSKFWLIAIVVFAVSCVTVNIYFPAKEVQEAADKIVQEIRGPLQPDSSTDKTDKKEGDQGFLQRTIRYASFIPKAHAAGVESATSPQIRALKTSLQSREPKLHPYFQAGNIGEGNDGFIAVRSTEGLDLKKTNILKNLTAQTNNERKSLYAEVAKMLNIDPTQLNRVQSEFAQVWQQYSKPGWYIQLSDGSWKKK